MQQDIRGYHSIKGFRPGLSAVAHAEDIERYNFETDIMRVDRIRDKAWLAEREARILAYIAKVEQHNGSAKE